MADFNKALKLNPDDADAVKVRSVAYRVVQDYSSLAKKTEHSLNENTRRAKAAKDKIISKRAKHPEDQSLLTYYPSVYYV